MRLLNAGCGTHYADGWVNTDIWQSDTTHPDICVEPGKPYPFKQDEFDAVFLGHVLEHMPWDSVQDFLLDIKRIAKPEAPILVTGPDVYKTIARWKTDDEPWFMVESVLEHQDFNWQPGRQHEWWDGAAHFWNCHETRVQNLLENLKFSDVQVLSDEVPSGDAWPDPLHGDLIWPIIGKAPWQFVIRCKNWK